YGNALCWWLLCADALCLVDPAAQDTIDQVQVRAHTRNRQAFFDDHCRGTGPEFFGKTTTYTFGHDDHLWVNLTIRGRCLSNPGKLTFSLATQRESNSGAEGARKPLIVFTQRSQYTREGGHNEINHPHARAPPPW